MDPSELAAEAAQQRYEAAEEAWLAGIRAGLDSASLSVLAAEVAQEAAGWNSAEHDAHMAATLHAKKIQHEYATERTEVLLSLWTDIVRAYHGLPALRDG